MAVDKMLLYCSRQNFKEDSTHFLAANNCRTPSEIWKRYIRYLSFTDGEFSKTGVVELSKVHVTISEKKSRTAGEVKLCQIIR